MNRLSTIPRMGSLANLGLQDDQDCRLLRRMDGTVVAVRPRAEEYLRTGTSSPAQSCPASSSAPLARPSPMARLQPTSRD